MAGHFPESARRSATASPLITLIQGDSDRLKQKRNAGLVPKAK